PTLVVADRARTVEPQAAAPVVNHEPLPSAAQPGGSTPKKPFPEAGDASANVPTLEISSAPLVAVAKTDLEPLLGMAPTSPVAGGMTTPAITSAAQTSATARAHSRVPLREAAAANSAQ